MNSKQAIGFFLLMLMLVTSYAMFGGVQHDPLKKAIESPHLNLSETPQISESHGLTWQENGPVDIGLIVVMLILIGITSLGGAANATKP